MTQLSLPFEKTQADAEVPGVVEGGKADMMKDGMQMMSPKQKLQSTKRAAKMKLGMVKKPKSAPPWLKPKG